MITTLDDQFRSALGLLSDSLRGAFLHDYSFDALKATVLLRIKLADRPNLLGATSVQQRFEGVRKLRSLGLTNTEQGPSQIVMMGFSSKNEFYMLGDEERKLQFLAEELFTKLE